MTSRPRTLEIRLQDQRVGWLVERDGRIGIRFNPEWRLHADRRVFSLSVEETGLADVRATPYLPAWFENLVPEGEMRRWIIASDPSVGVTDLAYLGRIGRDLVGAVTVEPVDADVPASAPAEVTEPERRAPVGGLRWSLAGVQLKLNLCATADRFTLPVHGQLGHFIAKFPDQKFPGVPVNEHATLAWAAAAQIWTVESELIDASRIDELPRGLDRRGEPVLLVRRFDRSDGRRVHAEEFAQAFGIRPIEKYARWGWRHHLKLVAKVAPKDTGEYLRRLLFVIATGNGDAHHKNWSFVYPDGRQPRLSPAYDQVATVQWAADDAGLADALAFRLGRSKRWEDVDRSSIPGMIREAREDGIWDAGAPVPLERVAEWVEREVRRIRETLPAAVAVAGPGYQAMIERHWARTPLFRL